MLGLARLRDLTIAEPSAPGRPLHLSAASGLVDVGRHLFVIADDELHLGVFPRNAEAAGQLLRLFEGALPAARAERKKQKPDLEVLTRLRSAPGYSHGALLVLGSGSTPERCSGVVLGLDADGRVGRSSRIIDCRPIVEMLRATIADLNIEGATIDDVELRLFHRGNNSFPESLVVRIRLSALLAAIDTGSFEKTEPLDICHLDLGRIGQVPYSVTDAAALPDGRTVITAVAEDTENAYADGACLGSMIGIVGRDMQVIRTWPLDRPYKVEGVSAKISGTRIDLLLVADADDPAVAASLYAATIMG
jgi:hypothetical protein